MCIRDSPGTQGTPAARIARLAATLSPIVRMQAALGPMKVFNEVRAERDAVIDAVLVSSGQEVEAGQALLRFA